LEKIARHSATLEQYPDSIRIFELLGTESLGNNLLKFGAKKHFLHAGFCILARGDFVAGTQAVERYSSLDYSFDSSREQRLLAALAQACEDYDAAAFATELQQFDSMTKLDPWEISMLLRVKKSLEGQVSVCACAGVCMYSEYVCMYVYIHVCMYVCMYVRMYEPVCMHESMYV
jgi:alpha-soluble NSF attachment protein